MAVIYLRHEKHGTKVACSEEEAKYDEGHGWVRYSLTSGLAVGDLVTFDKAVGIPPSVVASISDNNVAQLEPQRQKRKYTREAA